MTKLYSDVAGKFPGASIIEVHRKYFSETRGLQMVKHLCALEYSSVELQLRHKYYALAAAACLLKYVEFIENIIYAPKVSYYFLTVFLIFYFIHHINCNCYNIFFLESQSGISSFYWCYDYRRRHCQTCRTTFFIYVQKKGKLFIWRFEQMQYPWRIQTFASDTFSTAN